MRKLPKIWASVEYQGTDKDKVSWWEVSFCAGKKLYSHCSSASGASIKRLSRLALYKVDNFEATSYILED
jgi:hypothetical protein